MKTLGTWLTLAIALGAGGGEAAEREVRSALGAQLNPAGLRFELGVVWRWRLFSSTSALLDDAHVALGVTDQLSPAYNRLEGWVEISPLSILDLRAVAEGVGYFGTFGSLVGFPSYDSDFSDDAREAIEDQAVARIGRRFYVSPALKFRAGRLSFRAVADFEWWRVHEAPREVYYEPFRGTLLDADGDALVSASSVLLFDVSRSRSERVRIGILHDYLNVWDAPQNRRQRLGALGLIKLGARLLGQRDPVLYVGVLDYLEVPNRSGVSAFVALTLGGRGALGLRDEVEQATSRRCGRASMGIRSRRGKADTRAAVESDPRGFLALHPAPAIFDEVQNVPSVLAYLEEAVDSDRRRPGQFLLTGSQNIALAQAVTESLAGRAANASAAAPRHARTGRRSPAPSPLGARNKPVRTGEAESLPLPRSQ